MYEFLQYGWIVLPLQNVHPRLCEGAKEHLCSIFYHLVEGAVYSTHLCRLVRSRSNVYFYQMNGAFHDSQKDQSTPDILVCFENYCKPIL